jgi:pimeloyl-ACP methyl ester carboxylesterase
MAESSLEKERFELRGVATHRMISRNSGRPLVYLHSVAGEVMELPFYAELAAHFALHVPAHPGFSEGPELDEVRDVEDLVYHYLDYFDAHGWSSVDIVGSCLGGWIAAELAARNPERVRSLTLLGAAGLHLAAAPARELFGLDAEETCALLFESRENPVAKCLAISPAAQAIGLAPKTELPLYRNQAAAARYGWAPYFHNPKLRSRLRRIAAPTLLLWGEHDRFIPVDHGRLYQSSIAGATLAVLPGCGHLPVAELPADAAARVRAHVERAS